MNTRHSTTVFATSQIVPPRYNRALLALIPEIDAMLHSLYDLLDALQELYYNGTRFQIAQFGTGRKYVDARTRTNTTVRTILSRLAGLN